MRKIYAAGFSLIELLITLAIMGVLAAFTIPPLFQMPAGHNTTKYSAMAKDVAVMVLSAFEQFKTANTTYGVGTKFFHMTQYMNYLKIDTSNSTYMNGPPAGTWYSGSNYCGA